MMRRHGWRVGMGLLLLAVLLAGCDSPTPLSEQAVLKRATPTATPRPSPTANSGSPAMKPCDPTLLNEPHFVLGDLVVVMRLSDMAHPGRKLPDGLALKPYQLPAAPGPALDQQLPLAPATNPMLNEPAGGYTLLICNHSTSQPHAINSISLQIASLTPYSGQLNEWMSGDAINCASYYARPQGIVDGDCGGAIALGPDVNCMHVTFPAAAVAGAVVAAYSNALCPTTVALPVKLNPQQMLGVRLGVTPPTTPGTYRFALGLSVDTTSANGGTLVETNPPTFSPAQEPLLLTPSSRHWWGTECAGPTMQAQIPAATTPPTYYICPES